MQRIYQLRILQLHSRNDAVQSYTTNHPGMAWKLRSDLLDRQRLMAI